MPTLYPPEVRVIEVIRGRKVVAVISRNCTVGSIPCEFSNERDCAGVGCTISLYRPHSVIFLTPNNYLKARLLGQINESTDA